MAVPKKKKSYSRSRQNRNSKNISIISGSLCNNCGFIKYAHNICEMCGYYKGQQIIKVKKDKKFISNEEEFSKKNV